MVVSLTQNWQQCSGGAPLGEDGKEGEMGSGGDGVTG